MTAHTMYTTVFWIIQVSERTLATTATAVETALKMFHHGFGGMPFHLYYILSHVHD